jgi:hypothetical protein
MHGVMRALIARWLALIAMLGLFAFVVATSRIPCVPSGLWPLLQLNCSLRSSVFRQRRETDGSLAANRSLDLRK